MMSSGSTKRSQIGRLRNPGRSKLCSAFISQRRLRPHPDATADLFVEPAKIDKTVRAHLGGKARLHPYENFYQALEKVGGKLVSLDPNWTSVAIYQALEGAGARVRSDRDPTIMPKAMKNPAEVEGMKQAHIRDGAALTRFLCWFSKEAPKGQLTELSAGDRLSQFRRETEHFHSLSFEPISCADGNAAMLHYRATPESDAPIGPDTVYLVDFVGQYPGGATDVARTVAVGSASEEVKARFTLILKGYIALQTTVFPAGITGNRIDAIARMPLWQAGFDCPHGIGHGVGYFLNVHEGPGFILAYSRPDEGPIEAGMILSDELGYYKPGHYGIRTENLMVVVERDIPGGERKMLEFETISMAPIDQPWLRTAASLVGRPVHGGCSACMAIYNISSRPFLQRSRPITFATFGMGVGVLCMVAISSVTGGAATLLARTGNQWFAIAYLGAIGGVVIYLLLEEAVAGSLIIGLIAVLTGIAIAQSRCIPPV